MQPTQLLYCLLVFGLCFSCGSDKNQSPQEQTEQEVFAQPLILGASISAGFETTDGGLGEVIVREINPNATIENRAQSGATSVESTQDIDFDATEPSVVIGVDLFFWDAVRNRCGEDFEDNALRLFNSFQEREIPMIIGQIPLEVDFPTGFEEAGLQSCAVVINELIAQECTMENNCLIYDPKNCFNAMGVPISPEGEPYFSDNFHTTSAGNEFCAEEFVRSGEHERLR